MVPECRRSSSCPASRRPGPRTVILFGARVGRRLEDFGTGALSGQCGIDDAGGGCDGLCGRVDLCRLGERALFRSSDGGKTWNTLVEAKGEFFSEVLVDSRQPQRVYAGAHGSAAAASIYRSTDGGQTWTLTHSVSPTCSPSFAPGSTPNTVLSACGLKMLRSQDGGASWTELPTPFLSSVRLASESSGRCSRTGGRRFFAASTTVARGLRGRRPDGMPGASRVGRGSSDDNVLVAGTGMLGVGGFLCGGIFRSADGGKTWGDNTLPDFYVTDVVIDPSNPSRPFSRARAF